MFTFHLLIAVVLAATHVRSVSGFQPGSDYNAYKTTNLYNCTGHTPVSNVTVRNAIDTLPQVEPGSGHGWEQWTIYLHGTFPTMLRWNQGNPSSSAPSPAYLDFLVLDVNGTTLQGKVVGKFSYTNSENVKQIAIGDNTLTWDADGLWYNASVNLDGYQLQLDSFSYVVDSMSVYIRIAELINSATLDSFHPNVAFYNGLLDQSGQWFGSVPIIRGHV